MKKSAVEYGYRKLPDGGFGIVVKVTVAGEWIETDTNTMPWPTPHAALKQAKHVAEQRAEEYGITAKEAA